MGPYKLTLTFLEVSAGPTLLDFCHLSESGPSCSADEIPKDPLRHNMAAAVACSAEDKIPGERECDILKTSNNIRVRM